MNQTVTCPHCQADISASILFRYVRYDCPQCGQPFTIDNTDTPVKRETDGKKK